MPSKRNLAIALIVSAILAAVVWGFTPGATAVETVPAERGRLAVTIEEEGKTRVTERYVVSAPVAGFVERIELEPGDAVEAGETVARLQPLRPESLDPRSRAEAEAAVARAEAALEAAGTRVEAALASNELAQVELARLTDLHQRGLAADAVVDEALTRRREAEATLRAAEAETEVARNELRAARAVLEYSATSPSQAVEVVPVSAPVTGRVLRVMHESEGSVSAGTPLLELADPRSLELEAEVLSQDAVRIEAGMPVRVRRWGGDGTLDAVVSRVEPSAFTKVSALGVEEQRVLVISELVSPPDEWSSLGDQYRAELAFVVWQDDDVLRVPASAVFRHGEGWAVFVAEEGRARLREIEPGRRNALQVEVREGLGAGEAVVVHPPDSLGDGGRVTTG